MFAGVKHFARFFCFFPEKRTVEVLPTIKRQQKLRLVFCITIKGLGLKPWVEMQLSFILKIIF